MIFLAVTYTKVYSDATTKPNETASSSFDISNTLPMGHVEQIGFRFTATTATTAASSASYLELVKSLRITINGDQTTNFNSLISNNASATVSRIGAFAQSIGGSVDESGAALAPEAIIWLPLGINLPAQSRFEATVGFGVAGAAIVTSSLEVWCKFGSSSSMTLVGNMTSEALAANSQTMVTVKIPNYKGATVAGICIQGPTAADTLTSCIAKSIGDFAMTPTFLRGAAASGNGYYFYDAGDSTTEYQYASSLLGFYFVPLYNLSVVNGSTVLLVESTTAQTYTFIPILNLPTTGNGEVVGKQTASVATGGSKSILARSEDI